MTITQNYPEELLHIRRLLLLKRYQQCIDASHSVLKSCDETIENHPFSEAFATFYLALAHDELARSMHEQSSFKIPTFNQAEQHYRQAIEKFPTLEQCHLFLTKAELQLDVFEETPTPTRCSSSASEYSTYGIDVPSPNTPPPHTHPESDRDNNSTSDEPKEAEASDNDSQDDFDDVLTPHRVLRRDISRISLLDQPLQRDYSSMSLLDARPNLSRSVSQGLLRPIRPGSPPKQYHLPPKLPYNHHNPAYPRLPRAVSSPPRTTSSQDTPSLAGQKRITSPQTPGAPSRHFHSTSGAQDTYTVPPLDPDSAKTYDTSKIGSPVSPPTPPQQTLLCAPTPAVPDLVLDSASVQAPLDLTHLSEHLSGMHAQLQTHLALLHQAKLRTTVAQAERAARIAMSKSPRVGITPNATASGKRIPHSKSFWSFTPVDVKKAEKEKRIEERRAKGWERKRYKSEKYVALAESALAEL